MASAGLPWKVRTASVPTRGTIPSVIPESKLQSSREQLPSLHFGALFLHVKPQEVPSHVATWRSLITVHGTHVAPHELTLPGSRQTPLQLRRVPGQVGRQLLPSQVTEPPVGATQALQSMPQLSRLRGSLQTPLQLLRPVGHWPLQGW